MKRIKLQIVVLGILAAFISGPVFCEEGPPAGYSDNLDAIITTAQDNGGQVATGMPSYYGSTYTPEHTYTYDQPINADYTAYSSDKYADQGFIYDDTSNYYTDKNYTSQNTQHWDNSSQAYVSSDSYTPAYNDYVVPQAYSQDFASENDYIKAMDQNPSTSFQNTDMLANMSDAAAIVLPDTANFIDAVTGSFAGPINDTITKMENNQSPPEWYSYMKDAQISSEIEATGKTTYTSPEVLNYGLNPGGPDTIVQAMLPKVDSEWKINVIDDLQVWKAETEQVRECIGICTPGDKEIAIYRPFVTDNDQSVTAHELFHAIVAPEANTSWTDTGTIYHSDKKPQIVADYEKLRNSVPEADKNTLDALHSFYKEEYISKAPIFEYDSNGKPKLYLVNNPEAQAKAMQWQPEADAANELFAHMFSDGHYPMASKDTLRPLTVDEHNYINSHGSAHKLTREAISSFSQDTKQAFGSYFKEHDLPVPFVFQLPETNQLQR